MLHEVSLRMTDLLWGARRRRGSGGQEDVGAVEAEPLRRTTLEQVAADGSVVVADEVMLRRWTDDTMELVAVPELGLPAFAPGAELRLRRTVRDDATYTRPVRLGSSPDGVVVPVEPLGAWARHQRRAHVRVAVPELTVHLVAEGAGGRVAVREARAHDLSAGGMGLLVGGEAYPVGTVVRALFELPAEDELLGLELRATVVRAVPDGGAAFVGLQWLGVDDELERRLTQWVFQRQAHRLHA